MRTRLVLTLLASLSLTSLVGVAASRAAAPGHRLVAEDADDLHALVDHGLSEDPATRDSAITALRSYGPEGLDAVLVRYALARGADTGRQPPSARPSLPWQRLADGVAQQRDAIASGLFWHTDLAAAKREAGRLGRPIFSLRMLGSLTDEYSCANSRLFRALLYAHPEVGASLAEDFVLHWASEREVPLVTVDFGDGRVLRRTITGNSIHYVLDAEGRPIDAIPGLYGPGAFLDQLDISLDLYERLQGALGASPDPSGAEARNLRESLLRIHHQGWLESAQAALERDIQVVGGQGAPGADLSSLRFASAPAARAALPMAITKMVMEMPMLTSMEVLESRARGLPSGWDALGEIHAEESRVHPASVALIRAQGPLGADGEELDDAQLARLIDRLEQHVAQDSVQNEYRLRRALRSWFAGSEVGTLEALNQRVYSEIFLTPATDPWLGLLQDDLFIGLDHSGVGRVDESPRD